MPPAGQNVIVTLIDGTEVLAYWFEDQWWIGVAYDPIDIVLEGVISWREVE